MMTVPIISAGVAAILIILQMVLMLSVGMYRTKVRVGVGVGQDQTLERLARRHGNLAENAGLFVAALALTEILGAPQAVVLGFGAVFVLARLLHALGFASPAGSHLADGSKLFVGLRAIGAFGTALSGLGLGGYLAYVLMTSSA